MLPELAVLRLCQEVKTKLLFVEAFDPDGDKRVSPTTLPPVAGGLRSSTLSKLLERSVRLEDTFSSVL